MNDEWDGKSFEIFIVIFSSNEREKIDSTKKNISYGKEFSSLNANYMNTCCNRTSIVLLIPFHRATTMWVAESFFRF